MIKHKKIPIDKIIILEENPRDISDKDLQKLCNDIKADPNFLYQRPSLVNFTNGKYYCYAGAQRIAAQKLLNEKEAICFVEKDVPEEVQKKRMLQDNLHRGKWNADKLLALDLEITELEEIGLDVTGLGLDVDVSILEDLEQNAFINSVKDEAETFGFTLQLPKEYKEIANTYVKENTKAPIVEHIIKIFTDA